VTHQDRPKLPLFVLAAGAILLGAAALQSVLIVGPGPGGSNPHAISIDTGRPAATPPSRRSLGPDEPSQTVPSPSAEASPAEASDQFPTAAVPDPPHNADHAVDPAGPARAAPEPAVSAGAEPPADTAPKAEPQRPATAPAAAADSAPQAEVKTAGPETPKAPEPVAAEPKVDSPAPESKPAPEPERPQVAKAKAADAKPEPVQAPPVPEEKPVAAEPKVETPPAASKPAPEPEPAQVTKSEPAEAKPKPLPAPPLPDAKPVIAAPKVGSPPVEAKPAPKPETVKAAKPVKAAKVEAVESKATPVEKKTAKAAAQGKSKSRPMSLGFGRAAKPPTTAGKVNSGRYAASVRAAVGRHRPRVGSGGSATVAFSIGPAGGLRGVRIVRSSGKPQLDQAAIATVRSAAPFPAPPTGVNPTFSIQIFFR
jgi:protein TonB